MRIAVLSDIHGNSWALSEVLKDIEKRKADFIVNLGDSLYGPLNPKETFELIKSNFIISISGNEDRLIVERNHKSPTLNYVIDELNDEAMDWLILLKKTGNLNIGIFICHGTPHLDTMYLAEQLNNGYISINDSEKLEKLLEGVNQRIVCCGHSHTKRFIQTSTRTIINSGSVGCPAFDDDFPIYHKMENFNNNAQYCIAEIIDNDVLVEQISVPYDVDKAANCAAKNNRSDWAKWIKTGRV